MNIYLQLFEETLINWFSYSISEIYNLNFVFFSAKTQKPILKIKMPAGSDDKKGAANQPKAEGEKRGRGRPPKDGVAAKPAYEPTGKPRGRPKKE